MAARGRRDYLGYLKVKVKEVTVEASQEQLIESSFLKVEHDLT